MGGSRGSVVVDQSGAQAPSRTTTSGVALTVQGQGQHDLLGAHPER